jgi:DNA-binding NtrC family response regulator
LCESYLPLGEVLNGSKFAGTSLMKTLMIVDDQVPYLDSLEVQLSKKFEVLCAPSKSEALKLLISQPIDLALLDIRLSEADDTNIDGLNLLEWITQNRPNISSFVMSAFREFTYAEKALNLGAKHFFRKPIDIITLSEILQEKG